MAQAKTKEQCRKQQAVRPRKGETKSAIPLHDEHTTILEVRGIRDNCHTKDSLRLEPAEEAAASRGQGARSINVVKDGEAPRE